MPRAECSLCSDHQAALPWAVCRACGAQHHRDLDALPRWYDALLERPRRGAGQRVSGTSSSTVPIEESPLRHRSRIRTSLLAQALHLAQSHHVLIPSIVLGPDQGMPVAHLVHHLSEHTDAMLVDERAASWCGDLRRLVETASRIAAPGRRTVTPIGACPDEGCPGQVLADTSTADAWCTVCGETGDITWWRRRMPTPEQWLPVGRLRMHLMVTYGRIIGKDAPRQWVQRGHVKTRTEGTIVLYDLRGVLAYLGVAVPDLHSVGHTVTQSA